MNPVNIRHAFQTITDPNTGTVTFDVAARGCNQRVVLTGNRAIIESGMQVGQKLAISLVQDSTGGREVTSWFGGGTNVIWLNNNPRRITTTPDRATLVNVFKVGANSYLAEMPHTQEPSVAAVFSGNPSRAIPLYEDGVLVGYLPVYAPANFSPPPVGTVLGLFSFGPPYASRSGTAEERQPAGSTIVQYNTAYSAGAGYGWSTNAGGEAARTTTTAPTNFYQWIVYNNGSSTFRYDLPNGVNSVNARVHLHDGAAQWNSVVVGATGKTNQTVNGSTGNNAPAFVDFTNITPNGADRHIEFTFTQGSGGYWASNGIEITTAGTFSI